MELVFIFVGLLYFHSTIETGKKIGTKLDFYFKVGIDDYGKEENKSKHFFVHVKKYA